LQVAMAADISERQGAVEAQKIAYDMQEVAESERDMVVAELSEAREQLAACAAGAGYAAEMPTNPGNLEGAAVVAGDSAAVLHHEQAEVANNDQGVGEGEDCKPGWAGENCNECAEGYAGELCAPQQGNT
jgi:hypothetical protein